MTLPNDVARCEGADAECCENCLRRTSLQLHAAAANRLRVRIFDRAMKSLHPPLQDRKPVLLLPLRRSASALKPRIGRSTRTAKCGDDLGGCVFGNLLMKRHGRTLARPEKYAMQKISVAISLQCRHVSRMSTAEVEIVELGNQMGLLDAAFLAMRPSLMALLSENRMTEYYDMLRESQSIAAQSRTILNRIANLKATAYQAKADSIKEPRHITSTTYERAQKRLFKAVDMFVAGKARI